MNNKKQNKQHVGEHRNCLRTGSNIVPKIDLDNSDKSLLPVNDQRNGFRTNINNPSLSTFSIIPPSGSTIELSVGDERNYLRTGLCYLTPRGVGSLNTVLPYNENYYLNGDGSYSIPSDYDGITGTTNLGTGTTIGNVSNLNLNLKSISAIGALTILGDRENIIISAGSGSTLAGLAEVTANNACTNVESWFNGGLITNKISPRVDSTTAIQFNKANGTTNIINIDTVSGLTGYGTTNPKDKIHVFGTDISAGSKYSVQTNGIMLDGVSGADKEIVWANNGIPKWQAQTFRDENDVFWYLTNTQAQSNPLTVMETGRFGFNKQSNFLNYHSAQIVSVTGLNDLIISGIYTQNYNTIYEIQIANTGVTDTWHWRKSIDAGISYGSYSSASGCTLIPVELEYGVLVNFEHTTGHGIGATWEFAGFSQIPQATMTLAPMGIQEIQTTNNYNSNPIIYNDITAKANGGLFGNQFPIFISGTGGTNQAFYLGFTVHAQMIYINLATFATNVTLITEYWNTDINDWTVLNNILHDYIDSTNNLSQSGRIIWQPSLMSGWNKGYITDLVEDGYKLYWLRLRTTTNPISAANAYSINIGNDKRFSIYNSFNDYRPSFYVDISGRVNVGGGNITGSNRLQVNTGNNVQVTASGTDSLVEIDSENSSVVDLKIKLASNDIIPPALTFVKTRGTLDNSSCTQMNDLLGAIKFRGRAGTTGRLLAEIGSQFVGTGTTRCADIYFNTANGLDPIERVRINYKGNTGFGITPTATIHIKSGTTINAPLKFTSGNLLTSPQSGAIEFKGNYFYGTTTGNTRQTFAFLNSPVFTGNPSLPSGTTFNNGLATSSIKPLSDSTQAIHINKANGITPIITIDSVSGLTGFGTVSPKTQISTYGVDNICSDNGWNIQKNGIDIDGDSTVDKNLSWSTNGEIGFVAQTYRNEDGRFWYLTSPKGHIDQLTISNTGRVGINNQTNIMAYHAILVSGSPNDIKVGGYYTENYGSFFEIEIDSITGLTDTFRWRISINNGDTYSAWSNSSGCTIYDTLIKYGVTIKFDSVRGHSLGTTFAFPAFAQLPIGTFVVTSNSFSEIQTTNNYHANPIIYNDITAEGNSSTFGSNILIFNSGTTNNAIYFGTLEKCNSIYFNLDTVGSNMILISEYWNGSNWIDIEAINHSYHDETNNLTKSGIVTWETSSMSDWIAAYMPNLVEDGYELYWVRFRTSTNPIIAPVANSFARNGKYRIAVLTSPFDTKPSFYVDSLGRTNIGGGNITGSNKLQINSYENLPVTIGGKDSLVEFDSEDSSVTDLKIKLSSNDALDTGLLLVNTRGTLLNPLSNQTGDMIGHIEFRGRFNTTGSLLTKIQSQFTGNESNKNGDIFFSTANNGVLVERVRITSSGTTGFGITPTAMVHIKAGSTTIAPLKFTSGSLLSSPQSGAVEFLTDNYYGTITTGQVRKTFAFIESPQFTGNLNLPNSSCLNNTNLCNYILNSGGTNNTNILTTVKFNQYTGATAPIINYSVTGATNGLSKSSVHNVKLGGTLCQDTVITGNSYNFTLSSKALNLCSNDNLNIISKGCSVSLFGYDGSGIEKTKLLINNSQAVFSDSRIIPLGLQYNADYSSTFSTRTLVDKGYVDSIATGLNVIGSVNIATIGNITLSGLTTIDGILLHAGNRVLVKDQSTGSKNGVYVASSGLWSRATDFDFTPAGEVGNGDLVPVISGTSNGNTIWVLTTPDPIVSGNTLTFTLFSRTSAVLGGNGTCVTQVSGNYTVAVKLPANSSLCADGSGLYLNSSVAGTGLAYNTGILSVNGSALAGNSLLWSGNTFNVNTATGTLSTALNSKLNTTIYQTYTGTTAPNRYLDKSIYQTYTGTTAPNRYLDKSIYQTYTGTTVPNTYYNKSCINVYSGNTKTIIDRKSYLSGATFTGIVNVCKPSQNDNSSCVATTSWYISQAGTANPIMNNIVCVGTSNLFSREDHIHPIDTSRLAVSIFNGYTGTTVPNTYLSKSSFNTYTGTTVPNTYLSKSSFNTYTGTTVPNTYYNKSCINVYTGNTKNVIDAKAYLSGATFTGVINVCKPSQNDNSSCVATTSWYISQGGTASPLINGIAGCGTSNLFSRQDHVHPTDTSRLAVSAFNVYSGTTVPSVYLSKSLFNTYSGTTVPNTYYNKTCINVYTGTTVPNTYYNKSCINVYTGTTVPNTYYNKSCINVYTGTTVPNTYATISLVNKKAYLSGATFTGVINVCKPSQNDNSSCVATTSWYISQAGTASPLMDGVATGGTSYLFARQDHKHPVDTSRLAVSAFNTYSGTTIPNTYYNKSCINVYTGTTVPNTYLSKSSFNTYSGTTLPSVYLSKSSFNTYSGTTVPNTYATLTIVSRKSFLSGATFTGVVTINSNLTVTGTTILRGTTCLGTPATADISTDRTLFWNPTSCLIRSIKLTGGTDSYFYTDSTSPSSIAAGTATCIYLSGTPWNFKTGRYQIDFNAQFGNTTANGETCAWFTLDGTVIGACYHGGGEVNNWVTSASLSRDITIAASGCHCLVINYARGANTACMTYGMIRAKRLC